MILIQINKKYKENISSDLIEETTNKVFSFLKIESQSDISILIDSDFVLRKLNRLYREIDLTTDVLSFESNEINPETGVINLGDIAISYPRAEKQAVEANHSVTSEIILLLVHAILHLSGFDHNSSKEKKEMWAMQQSILENLGIKINRISGDDNFHD